MAKMSKEPKGHLAREIVGKMNEADVAHELTESFGYEVKEHGLNVREAEKALVHEEHVKYLHKPRSKFHI